MVLGTINIASSSFMWKMPKEIFYLFPAFFQGSSCRERSNSSASGMNFQGMLCLAAASVCWAKVNSWVQTLQFTDYRITLSRCPKVCGWGKKPPAERDHEEQQQKNTKRSQKREIPHPRRQRRQRAWPALLCSFPKLLTMMLQPAPQLFLAAKA